MDHHLASEPGTSRNGYGARTVLTDTGRIVLAMPRDRQASFDPQLITKYQRRFPGFDDKIVLTYVKQRAKFPKFWSAPLRVDELAGLV